ncbi:Cytochrome P450 monooxygenase ATR2 [Paramyrothecium foliicola]|nr:Cytochrome P450 monooxygenase ATR2 [Paramyrothecium foliicola]
MDVLNAFAERGPLVVWISVVFVGVLVTSKFLGSPVKQTASSLPIRTKPFTKAYSLLVAFVSSKLPNPIKHIPVLDGDLGSPAQRRQAFLANPTAAYKKGYELFGDKPFRLMTENGEKVVVPHKSLDYLRRMPDNVLNATKALYEDHHGRYTGVGNQKLLDFLNQVVRGGLTHGLNQINERLSNEITEVLPTEFGECDDWTSVAVYSTLLRVVAITSGSVFFGPEHCRNEKLIQIAIDYATSLFMSISRVKEWHPWMRWVGSFFIGELGSLAKARKAAQDFLIPIIHERRKVIAAGGEVSNDCLQWMIKLADEKNYTDEDICETQLDLSFAAVQTTTLTVSYILHDLVLRPKLVEELRDEVKQALRDHNGEMSTTALFQLRLMDSVMKESQRLNPIGPARFSRLLEKPIKLQDGTPIPAGAMIQASLAGIVSDPNFYPNPEVFDPYRFYNIRNGVTPDPLKYGTTEQYQFASVTKDFMGFGYGRHACPGRFFAANEIKHVLAHILLKYDIQMPGGQSERYSNVSVGISSVPDPTKSIMFKRIKTQ